MKTYILIIILAGMVSNAASEDHTLCSELKIPSATPNVRPQTLKFANMYTCVFLQIHV